MAKIEEKAKVGRPKLADEELLNDSWCKIISCLAIILAMTVCGIGVLTGRTPSQVLMLRDVENLSGSVAKLRDPNTRIIDVDSLGNSRKISAKSSVRKISSKLNSREVSSLKTKSISAKSVTRRKIGVDGTVTEIISAIPTKVINID